MHEAFVLQEYETRITLACVLLQVGATLVREERARESAKQIKREERKRASERQERARERGESEREVEREREREGRSAWRS